jgi:hypothetical protein
MSRPEGRRDDQGRRAEARRRCESSGRQGPARRRLRRARGRNRAGSRPPSPPRNRPKAPPPAPAGDAKAAPRADGKAAPRAGRKKAAAAGQGPAPAAGDKKAPAPAAGAKPAAPARQARRAPQEVAFSRRRPLAGRSLSHVHLARRRPRKPGPRIRGLAPQPGLGRRRRATRRSTASPGSSQPAFEAVGRALGPGRADRLWLVKPQTFMNESGRAVGGLARYHKLPPGGRGRLRRSHDRPRPREGLGGGQRRRPQRRRQPPRAPGGRIRPPPARNRAQGPPEMDLKDFVLANFHRNNSP